MTTDTRFRDRAELLDFLLEVATTASATLDLDQLLPNIGEIVREVVPFELFAILFYSDRTRGLRIRYSIGHREEVVRSLVLPLGQGITGVAAEARQPILCGDVSQDPRYINAVDAVRSEMAVPMVHRGRLVGVIDMQSTQADAYTQEDSSLLQLIASRVAVAIDNARLYRRVERQNRTLRTLARLSQEFSSILNLDELLEGIAKTVRSLISFDGFAIMLLDEENLLLRQRYGLRYDERVHQDHIPLGKGITGTAAELREVIRVEDTSADPRYIAWTPGIRSELAIPLLTKDGVIGVMDLESERLGYFTDEHVQLLRLIAPLVATSVENARLYDELARNKERLDKDLATARNVQSLLLPRKAPDIPGLDIAVRLRPAREISGDVYDFFVLGEEFALIAFGDVSGKSVAAALYGALVGGLLRTVAARERTPAGILYNLNRLLMERQVETQYLTLSLMLWEAARRQFTFASAGALPPMVCRKGKILPQKLEGVPLGLLPHSSYDELVFPAEPDDLILLYSDGIVDQHNSKEEEYGAARLEKVLNRTWHQNAEAVCDAILRNLKQHTGAHAVFDDQTLVAMKVRL